MEEPVWVYPKENSEVRNRIVSEFNCHPVIAEVLVARGFTSTSDVNSYLYGQLPDLHDPFLLSEMPQAVERICQAVRDGERILIYGDNDVDGMTGTALLYEFFQYLGGKVYFLLASRTSPRDQMLLDALDEAIEKRCKLLITVDCGITSALEVDQVIKKEIDVIITDHHEPTDKIPNGLATLNPKLLTDNYPNRHLTGVGVAFKLAHAVTNHLVELGVMSPKRVDLKRYLDLVALGTVSDMGALIGENRILVRYGLRQLRRAKRIGLAKLVDVAEGDVTRMDTGMIASKVAPRLNSSGRIADPRKGIELLLARSTTEAEDVAKQLDLNNAERQKIERSMVEELEAKLAGEEGLLDHRGIVLDSSNWHPGVIPILCTRISKIYNRPTVLISVEGGMGKGSIRSIRQFPILPALKNLEQLLVNFGGHDLASGLSIHKQKIPEFKKGFLALADEALTEEDTRAKIYLDAEVSFKELTFDFMESIKLMEPFGNENQPPVFYCKARQVRPPKIVGKSHLRLYLEQGERVLEGIGFGMAKQAPLLRKKGALIEVAFTPQINDFQKKASIQLLIRDFRNLD